MCGIAGIVVADRERLDSRSLVERMQCNLAHRGPDDRGSFISVNGLCALAHTRLSILDLSRAGHQPMASTDGRYWLSFNGEIYNFRELRQELDAASGERGAGSTEHGAGSLAGETANGGRQSAVSGRNNQPWRSNSDTEVILRAYARWGISFLQKLRGMFAIAIWDEQEQELILARDPFGIKPIYYHAANDKIIFASEVRALLASGLLPRKLNIDGVSSYFQFGSVQDPLTIVDGVRTVMPGHYLTVTCREDTLRIKEISYVDLFGPENLASGISDRREAVITLQQILEESVRLHLISDVPVGVFLSGGIDSSALVALMNRVIDQPPQTFSVVFPEADFSEAEHARRVAKAFGTEHREIVLSEDGLLCLLPSALKAMDRPTMDGINTYVISKAVKEAGGKVALSGLGGDELFAGYPSFRRAEQARRLALLPRPLRQSAATWGRAFLNGSVRTTKFWDLVASDCSPCSVYKISRRLFGSSEIGLLLRDLARAPQSSSCVNPFDTINAVAIHELTGYLTNTLLRDTDQMSMAHSLEIRVPFIDPRVVRYVLGLPGEWKMDKQRPKPLLLDALGKLLPEEVWRRPKMGFTLPFSRWMGSALKPELEGALLGDNTLGNLGINSDYVRQVWNAFKNNPQHEPWSRSWALYVLKRWCEENGVTA